MSLNIQGMNFSDDGFFSRIDVYFASFMQELASDDCVWLASALLSRSAGEGHICLDLRNWAGKVLDGCECPGFEEWTAMLRGSGVVGFPGEVAPIILDPAGRLYMMRYWEDEQVLVERIRAMNCERGDYDPAQLRCLLEEFFPGTGIDMQEVAACIAWMRGLCVVTGGPGTGKTTTVAKMIAIGVRMNPLLRVALCAPTGKAANRLLEAVGGAKERLDIGDGVFPGVSYTIHRLLGVRQGRFVHDRDNPLDFDLVVVDEASMVDLPLMASLVGAMKEGSRLVLLGDKDQLASVEAGYVLGDICDAGAVHGYSSSFVERLKGLVAGAENLPVEAGPGGSGIADSMVELRKTYRFSGGIGELSAAINRGDAPACIEFLEGGGNAGRCALPLPGGLADALKPVVEREIAPLVRLEDPEQALARLKGFRILCALRAGPYGVARVNGLVEEILGVASGGVYHGRPVMVTRNDYGVGLFNGDVGIVMRDPESGDMRVFFEDGGGVRAVPPSRMPEHESAFAMSVHKSQGSEFDHVMLVLPDRETPVLTRELVYTGVTRARNEVVIWMDEGVFAGAVRRRTRRSSGLRDALWSSCD